MEPLSIAASVAGLLGATAKVSTTLTTFIRGTVDAPKLANGVLQEVSDISACLGQLQAFLVGTRVGSRSRTALIMVEQVVAILTACVMTFSELEEILESLKDRMPTGVGSRIAWMKKEPALAKLCLRLNSSKQSLNLMLTTLTCASVDQATNAVEKLTSVVQNLVQSNQDLCSRIGNLESSNRTIRPTASLEDNVDECDASTIRSDRQKCDSALEKRESVMTAIKRFTFEQDLRQSRVYRRVRQRDSLKSRHSSAAPSFGWSCLSEMSLANVSNISVISLPIAATELANAQHYALPPTTNGNLNPWNKPYDMIKARASMQLNRSPNGISAISDDAVPALGNYHHEERSSHLPESIKTIVILGSSLSGKTTIYRQLKALNGCEFKEHEKEEIRSKILDNLLSASLLIYFKIDSSGIELSTKARNALYSVNSFHSLEKGGISWQYDAVVRYVRAFRELLLDPDVCRLMHLEDWLGLHDNIEFLLSRSESLFVGDCTAANIDVFHARSRTTEKLCKFSYELGAIRYDVIDFGESCPSERNWSLLLHSIFDYVLYTVALSGYCRRSSDDNGVNQMRDAMRTFQMMIHPVKVPIFLLFTKNDIFEENLKTHPFSDFFPEFHGVTDSNSIRTWLVNSFRDLDKRSVGELYCYIINATDSADFKEAFEEIELKMSLKKGNSLHQQASPKSKVIDCDANGSEHARITSSLMLEEIDVSAAAASQVGIAR